jgi:hypothetical protein
MGWTVFLGLCGVLRRCERVTTRLVCRVATRVVCTTLDLSGVHACCVAF